MILSSTYCTNFAVADGVLVKLACETHMYVLFFGERSDDWKYVCVSQAVVKWGVNMVVFSCYFIVPETPADKKVPFFEVGSCSWGTYWQFRLGRFLIRFLQVIFMKDIIDC